MIFKAPTKTKPTRTSLNHLDHTIEGASGYQPELELGITPSLDFEKSIHKHSTATLLLNMKIFYVFKLDLVPSSISKLLKY
jgi:hypothetical protein